MAMAVSLLLVQTLNGIQFGVLLFLLAAGLTLVFGIMDLINLAHAAFYMMGAYFAATLYKGTASFPTSELIPGTWQVSASASEFGSVVVLSNAYVFYYVV
jgi:branched-subunit amino acid ABC-type transport system permease component